jgi:hypothetical protein
MGNDLLEAATVVRAVARRVAAAGLATALHPG